MIRWSQADSDFPFHFTCWEKWTNGKCETEAVSQDPSADEEPVLYAEHPYSGEMVRADEVQRWIEEAAA